MVNPMNVKELYTAIAGIAKSESNNKERLALVCNGILKHHQAGGHDVGIANRLLSVLSPANKKAVKGFLKAHMPYAYDDSSDVFNGLIKKDRAKAAKIEALENWCASDKNIWDWLADQGVQSRSAARPYEERIEALISKALKAKEPVTTSGVVQAVLKAGVSIPDLIKALESMDDSEYEVVYKEVA